MTNTSIVLHRPQVRTSERSEPAGEHSANEKAFEDSPSALKQCEDLQKLPGDQSSGLSKKSIKILETKSIHTEAEQKRSDAAQSSATTERKPVKSVNDQDTTELTINASSPVENRLHRGMSSSPPRAVALLVASLGNPPPYQSTRHSAGHLVLKHLQYNLSLPSFIQKSKPYGGGHVSHGADVGRPEYTLWQSPSLMNNSGPALLQAYKTFLSNHRSSSMDPITGLVILHDEMEITPGKIKVRRGGNSSAKGHNGIKSVQSSLNGAKLLGTLGNNFIKIGIGIGRPNGGSRESKDVSAYVLGQVTSREKEGLEITAREVEVLLYQEMGRVMQQPQS